MCFVEKEDYQQIHKKENSCSYRSRSVLLVVGGILSKKVSQWQQLGRLGIYSGGVLTHENIEGAELDKLLACVWQVCTGQ
jgi:hypothetical protein